jgi:uncharacterized membrane protein
MIHDAASLDRHSTKNFSIYPIKTFMNLLVLIIGLILFLGMHSARIFADGKRTQLMTKLGANGWKGLYALISLAGFILIIYGFGIAREAPVILWESPRWTRHLAALLTLPAFVLMFASQIPGTHIKARLKHPMVLGVKLWAFAHLLANGRLHDVILFGAFLLWAVLSFRAARRRDRALGTVYVAAGVGRDLMAIALGIGAWAAFAFYLHIRWIGVQPFG